MRTLLRRVLGFAIILRALTPLILFTVIIVVIFQILQPIRETKASIKEIGASVEEIQTNIEKVTGNIKDMVAPIDTLFESVSKLPGIKELKTMFDALKITGDIFEDISSLVVEQSEIFQQLKTIWDSILIAVRVILLCIGILFLSRAISYFVNLYFNIARGWALICGKPKSDTAFQDYWQSYVKHNTT